MSGSAVAIVVVIGLLAGGFAWAVVKGAGLQRRRDGERRALARSQGWTYTGERTGKVDYRFDGAAGGIEWTMWYDPDRGDRSPTPRAHWHCDNLQTAELSLVVIGRRRYQLESGTAGRVLMGVVAGVVDIMAGTSGKADKAAFYDNAVEATGLGPAFRERYAVVVAPGMPRDCVDAPLQALLMRWPGDGAARFRSQDAVEITLGKRGLHITVQRMPPHTAHWRPLARAREHVAQRLAQAQQASTA